MYDMKVRDARGSVLLCHLSEGSLHPTDRRWTGDQPVRSHGGGQPALARRRRHVDRGTVVLDGDGRGPRSLRGLVVAVVLAALGRWWWRWRRWWGWRWWWGRGTGRWWWWGFCHRVADRFRDGGGIKFFRVLCRWWSSIFVVRLGGRMLHAMRCRFLGNRLRVDASGAGRWGWGILHHGKRIGDDDGGGRGGRLFPRCRIRHRRGRLGSSWWWGWWWCRHWFRKTSGENPHQIQKRAGPHQPGSQGAVDLDGHGESPHLVVKDQRITGSTQIGEHAEDPRAFSHIENYVRLGERWMETDMHEIFFFFRAPVPKNHSPKHSKHIHPPP